MKIKKKYLYYAGGAVVVVGGVYLVRKNLVSSEEVSTALGRVVHNNVSNDILTKAAYVGPLSQASSEEWVSIGKTMSTYSRHTTPSVVNYDHMGAFLSRTNDLGITGVR